MIQFVQDIPDERLVAVIQAFDRQGLPLERRMEGDDELLRTLMEDLGVRPLVANAAVVMTAVLREAVVRGIQVPDLN